jgi:hypothetical protein
VLRYIAIVAVVLMVFGGSAYATPVSPGGSVMPDDFTTSTTLPAATVLQASHTGTWSTPGSAGVGAANGTYTDAVYKTTAPGVLDFLYQFSDASTSGNSITSTTALSFAGFCTALTPCDVGFYTNGGSLPTSPFVNGGPPPGALFLISDNATTVTFNMNVLPSQNITPGVTSEVLVIQAHAPHFTPGMVGLVAGGTANLFGYQPSAVPEPSFFLPLGAGLLAAFVFGRRKLAQRT